MRLSFLLFFFFFLILNSSCKMNQRLRQIDSFYIIGISTETTNKNGQASQDMGALWGDFFAQQVSNKIPNKISEDIYAIYTDYESDYTGRYTAIIGHKVNSLQQIPTGFIGKTLTPQKYQHFLAKGEMPVAVGITWNKIWNQEKTLNRSYIADFEIYSPRSQNGDKSEVDIYVGVK